ncbi:MAG: CRTAC1 family protein [Isosphaeraceae bacterium]
MSCNPMSCNAQPDHVFRNDGGRFVDVSEASGVRRADTDGRGLGVVAADLDEDGKIDLFVANDKSANFLFRNLGGFKFSEIAHEAGVAGNAEGGYQAGMGVASGDFDDDGKLDLFVTNYYGESVSEFRNFGGWVFIDRTQASGLGALSRTRLGFGVGLFDVNNDSRPDLLTANGHTDDLGDTPYRMPMQLLLGMPEGRFQDATTQAGSALTRPRLGRGLAIGDLDNDGRIDALVVDQNQPIAMLHNTTPRVGHWIGFVLAGTTSNRDGVGAIVSVDATRRRHSAQRLGGGSYLAANDARVHFGLGRADRVDEVEVDWPSGKISRYPRLAADRYYLIREGAAEAVALPLSPGWHQRR